jgi:putative ABC transport system permease protein
LFGVFGTLAVALAAVGIYGALAFSIRQRTPEFGVRIAFGADPFDIVTMVVRQALPVVLVGWVLGALATFSLTSSIRSLLFNVAPGDVAPFVSASMIVLIAALAGSLIPAIRAVRIEPAVALRAE